MFKEGRGAPHIIGDSGDVGYQSRGGDERGLSQSGREAPYTDGVCYRGSTPWCLYREKSL